MTGFEFDYLTYFRNMAFVIGLIVIFSFILVKLKSGQLPIPLIKKWLSLSPAMASPDKKIRVIERLALETRKGLYLVEVWNQVWLIGTTDSQIQLIGKLDGVPVSETKPFSEYINEVKDIQN